jgi:BR serine/threonine kinase
MTDEGPQMVGPYAILYSLGAGATGKVKLGQHTQTGLNVAIKVIKKSHFEKSPELKAKVQREIALMRLFDHPHLLKLIEVCESANHLYIVLEYAPHGELFDILIGAKALPVDSAMRFFRQIIYGVEFLHTHAICHRDLKPENILLDEFENVKIGDFGFARWMRANIAETSCGSPHYAAPEVIRGIPYDGRAADIWSCGVILFALLAGRLPFYDQAIRNLLAKVKAGQYVMPDFPPDIQSLVSSMLTVDPQKRITIEHIKDHPAFRIGLHLPGYVCPTPLPLPSIAAPIDRTKIEAGVLEVLRQIGFGNDTELAEAFSIEGTTWAKVFYHRLTTSITLENLPWDGTDESLGASDDHFILSPESEHGFTIPVTDPFHRRRHSRHAPSPGGHSLVEPATWAAITAHEYKADLVQPCVEIALPLDVLMGKMQLLLSELGFVWFHPDDLTIVATLLGQGVYLVVKVEFETPQSLSMNLFFTQATQTIVQQVIEGVRTHAQTPY